MPRSKVVYFFLRQYILRKASLGTLQFVTPEIVTNFGTCVLMIDNRSIIALQHAEFPFRVNPFGVAFGLVTVSDLLLIDHEGNVVGGGKRDFLLRVATYLCLSNITDVLWFFFQV